MSKPRKHAELIKAWADGAEIEVLNDEQRWEALKNRPMWYEDMQYRIKPEPKPDVFFEVIVRQTNAYPTIYWPEHWERPNIQFIFDGETGRLKKAEVLE